LAKDPQEDGGGDGEVNTHSIIKFKRSTSPRLSTNKAKSKPRLRVIQTEKDLRIPKDKFARFMDAWLASLGDGYYTIRDDKYQWICVSKIPCCLPVLSYYVVLRTRDVHPVEGLFVHRKVILGNVVEGRGIQLK
jgi:hypothetical protein